MDSPFSHELQIAIRAVQSAAKISQWVLSSDDKGTVEKDDLSPVTIADFAIQALLTSTVYAIFPDDKFVGEESAAELRDNPLLLNRVWELLLRLQDDEARSLCKLPRSPEEMCEMIDRCGFGEPGGSESGRIWVFDPIDGTKTFVRREAYAINVALLEGGKQVLSVVGCPTLPANATGCIDNTTFDPTGSIVFAVKGHGTYIRALVETAGEDILVRRIEPFAASMSLADLRPVSCYHMLDSGVDEAHEAIFTRLGITTRGCDFLAWVLRWVTLGIGLANITVWVYRKRERTGKVWDHAGAMLLFEEIGGKITDVDGKDIDLTAGRKLTGNHGFVAAPRGVHDIVLKTVHDVLYEQGKANLLA
ncbi:carbohydrate phosphatase [Xylaria bambusicola]|uniref:carbohydrate phosphatase n=1 Tax=Xylaria bambusicola TaxID=326684 RepID=UPI0020089E2D|nr:carbohydrate phosphatase [Xylaria bambusicola]KAI0526285.1 carbohydrate phosphatase [Xylaria bambusicola]